MSLLNSAQRPRAKVLFVDDEPRVLRTLSMLCEDKYDVYTACDAAQAQALFKESGPFNLVVSDEVMPNIEGHELLTWCKQEDFNCSRILLTGKPITPEFKANLKGAEVYQCIAKPWEVQSFQTALDNAISISFLLS